MEKDAKKLKTLLDGHCPIFEPGLHELMQEHYASGQLQFTDNVKTAVKEAEVVFLCVGTPSKPDGTVEMSDLEAAGKEVCDALAEYSNDYLVTIVVKSTVPAGTNRKLYNFLKEQTRAHVQVVSNPEFLREGSAVKDCLEPDRIVIGGESPEAFRIMRRLYDPLVKREENFMTMNWESAELTKYSANAMLAARISFMNEMTILCEGYGADIEDVRKGIGSDSRIGPAFLRRVRLRRKLLPQGRGRPRAYLPRRRSREPLCEDDSSHQQGPETAICREDGAETRPAARRGEDRRLGPGIQSRHRRHSRIPRPGRDPPSPGQGGSRQGHRSQGHGEHEADLQGRGGMERGPRFLRLGADAVALLTDWPQYTTLPFRKIAATMSIPVIFDGRNCLHRDIMREAGFQYYPIGRPAVENSLRLKHRV